MHHSEIIVILRDAYPQLLKYFLLHNSHSLSSGARVRKFWAGAVETIVLGRFKPSCPKQVLGTFALNCPKPIFVHQFVKNEILPQTYF